MSTNDVPGANPANMDQLRMGCWAEHDDGSLILVESTEGGRVIYCLFDTAEKPVVEYRDAMALGAFEKTFSWKPGQPKNEKWVWHDKTPFPWDRIIKLGAKAGKRDVSADETLTAAERIRKSRELRGAPVDDREVESRMEKLGVKAKKILKKLQAAIEELDA